MEIEANSYGEENAWGKAKYQTSAGSSPNSYTTSGSSAIYRAKVTLEISGQYDGGCCDTELLIQVKMYKLVSGSPSYLGSTGVYQLTDNDRNFDDETINIYAGNSYLSAGTTLYIEIYIYLYAETPMWSWQGESPIQHDFWDGANQFDIKQLYFQKNNIIF